VIVDSSALLAIVKQEAERPIFGKSLAEAPRVAMSTATWVECCLVVDNHPQPMVRRRFDDLVTAAGIELVSVSVEHAQVARAAHRDFGRGSGSPARLNYGSCFSYALARVSGEPLLFKGDDFRHTDVTPAL